MAAPKASKAGALEINRVETTTRIFPIIGKRPIICNRLSEKTKRELLAPAGRKNAAQRQASLKHDPFDEYRRSPYLLKDENAPTYLAIMSSAFKGAMATAALDLPGARKAQIGRLVWVEDDFTPLFGIPHLSMACVRSSDINHTPDIRTRAIVNQWACKVSITFVETLIKEQAILNLLIAAGLTAGVGDWRNEKGKGTYGQFEVVTTKTQAAYDVIIKHGGRAAQIAAMEEPECADDETQELLDWWENEVRRRGFQRQEPLEDDSEDETETEDESIATSVDGVDHV